MEGVHFGYTSVGWNIKSKEKLKTNQNSKRDRNHDIKGKCLRRQMQGSYNEFEQNQKQKKKKKDRLK